MMDIDIRLGERTSKVSLVKRDKHILVFKVDEEEYVLDVERVESGVYSIIYNGRSFDFELTEGASRRDYYVNSLFNAYEVEIIDAITKYQQNRGSGLSEALANSIIAPMPGKIIKVLVSVGQKLEKGTIAIIVEAMKMQSEYKVGKDCMVKEILVNEGDTVVGNQQLITFEDCN